MIFAIFKTVIVFCASTTFIWAHSFGSARVEKEFKLQVPQEKREEIWNYLLRVVKEKNTRVSTEYFTDDYYESRDLSLIRSGVSVRLRTRLIPSNPKDPKHQRKLVQLKFRSDTASNTSSEFKYPVAKVRSGNESFPSLVKKEHQEDLLLKMRVHKVDVDSLFFAFQIKQKRRRLYMKINGDSFITMTLDEASTEFLWKTVNFTELEIEINETQYTTSGSEKREKLDVLNGGLKTEMMKAFPYLKEEPLTKPQKMLGLLEDGIPFLDFILKLKSFIL